MRWKLRALMVKKGWSLATLADEVGVHRSNLSRYFRGETDLRASTYTSMLSTLGISLDEVLIERLGQDGDAVGSTPAVDLWRILTSLDGFSVVGILDRILSTAKRQGIRISERDRRNIGEFKSSFMVINRRGGRDGSGR